MKYILIEISHILKDIFFSLKYLKKYKIKVFKKKPLFICVLDGRFNHGGICDRFKGIISLYAYCKQRGYDFKIFFVHPFTLSEYLLPNNYNWILNEDDSHFTIFNTRIMYSIGEYKGRRLLSLSDKKNVLFYGNRDLLDVLNQNRNTNYEWGELFHELFKMTPRLKETVCNLVNEMNNKFFSAVFRFQQLLGDFKEKDFPILNDAQRKKLIEQCLNSLVYLKKETGDFPILVTSDSVSFLNEVGKLQGFYIIPGEVVHIEYTNNANYDIYLKTFVDFFVLSKSEKIYSLGTQQMYPTEFPLYAAKINNIPFERRLIE